MLLTALLSFAAGCLTVLAPCVLPFLPVIVGGSLKGDRRRPFIVAAALVLSLLVFTLLLKATTLLIAVDPRVWTTLSGALVIALGLSMLFPGIWASLATRTGFDRGSHAFLDKAVHREQGVGSAVLTGLALGPVFSSCSPTYAWLIATVLPASPVEGLVHLALYCTGVALVLLLIALLGRRLVQRLRWAADPRGWFQRGIALLFILVGILVITGADHWIQTWLLDHVPAFTSIEDVLLPSPS